MSPYELSIKKGLLELLFPNYLSKPGVCQVKTINNVTLVGDVKIIQEVEKIAKIFKANVPFLITLKKRKNIKGF